MKENGGGERKAGVGGMDGATRNAFCQCTDAKKARVWDEDAKSQKWRWGVCGAEKCKGFFARWDKSGMRKEGKSGMQKGLDRAGEREGSVCVEG